MKNGINHNGCFVVEMKNASSVPLQAWLSTSAADDHTEDNISSDLHVETGQLLIATDIKPKPTLIDKLIDTRPTNKKRKTKKPVNKMHLPPCHKPVQRSKALPHESADILQIRGKKVVLDHMTQWHDSNGNEKLSKKGH
jgi:hypothetical protein